LACLLPALTGCSYLRIPGSPPKAQVGSLQLTNRATGPVTPTVLQAQVMRFADTYVATVAQACDDVTAKATNSDVRLVALRWKLGQATSAYTDATGQNPAVNTLDLLVLVTMARMVVEEYGVETYGDAILPLLDTQRNLETNAWTLAGGVLQPSQQQELRDLIQEWRAKNPHQHYIGPIRFREFVSGLGMSPTKATTAPTSIFSLLYLDPLAGLDPTAAAIEETRELGERAIYYSQRMPQLLSWQIELLAYQLAGQPESKQILDDASRLASSAEIFAKTAQQLPQLVNDQRQAAIQQLLDGLRSQATDVRETLNAGGEAATAINAAIKSLDGFVRYVSPPNTNPAAASTNSRPFNVLDYGTAAGQIGDAAKDLNALLTTLNQSTTQLAQLGQQTTADANRVVDHAFRRGLILILVLLIGSVVAGLTYRILASKLAGDGRKPTELDP
jgi:methyl-accepting chemotaxis protein